MHLLRKKVLQQVPPEGDQMKELCIQIVRKCNGLPLAIVSLSGILLTKEKVVFELQRLLNNLSFEFRRNPNLMNVSKILNFSYEDLPLSLQVLHIVFWRLY